MIFIKYSRLIVISLLTIVIIASCSEDKNETGNTGPEPFTYDAPWPTDMASVLDYNLPDSANDQIAMPVEQAGPPYSGPVIFPSIDLTNVSLGIDSIFLYMRVDFVGTIPTGEVHVLALGEIEDQYVKNQGMNIALNTDNDIQTGGGGEGVNGIDIFFAISFDFGISHSMYANYNFTGGDLHLNNGQITGELGEGGPGFNYAIARYDISGIGSILPLGDTVEVGSWSEAESYNFDGTLKYHHYAFDRLPGDTIWPIPID